MAIIFLGMVVTFAMLLNYLPAGIGFSDALHIAGKMGKLEVVNFEFNLADRYNFWSGMTGALFLFLSYFGTDQSQVQRYLSGNSVGESRFGLLFNGLLKVPIQFFILLVGVMVFVFYQFNQPPLLFNQVEVEKVRSSEYANQLKVLEKNQTEIFNQKRQILAKFAAALETENREQIEILGQDLRSADGVLQGLRNEAAELVKQANPEFDSRDQDYVFITFILSYLPHGIIGLLLAVIFSAAMSSTSSEINALASTSMVDFYRRVFRKDGEAKHDVLVTKLLTVGWGLLAIGFAIFSSQLENLIQAVNILGSVFYGPILGIFVVAFTTKYVRSNAVFLATFAAEAIVVLIFYLDKIEYFKIGYLWLNPIGCGLVVLLAFSIQTTLNRWPTNRA